MANGYNIEQHMSRGRNLDTKKQRLVFTRSREGDTLLFSGDIFLMQSVGNEKRGKETDGLSGDLAFPNVFVCKNQYIVFIFLGDVKIL